MLLDSTYQDDIFFASVVRTIRIISSGFFPSDNITSGVNFRMSLPISIFTRFSSIDSTENIEMSLRASATVVSPLLSLVRISVRFNLP